MSTLVYREQRATQQYPRIFLLIRDVRDVFFGRASRAPVFSIFTSRFPADHRIKNEKLTRGPGEGVSPTPERRVWWPHASIYWLQARYVCPGRAAAAAAAVELVLWRWHRAHSSQQAANTNTNIYRRTPHGCRHSPAPTFAGTHAPARAGQYFDLSDSVLDKKFKPLPHNTLYTLVECNAMPSDR